MPSLKDLIKHFLKLFVRPLLEKRPIKALIKL